MSRTLASFPLIQSAFSLPYCITESSCKRKQNVKIEREKRTKVGGKKRTKVGKKRKEKWWRNNFSIGTRKNTVLLLLEQALLCFLSSSPTTPYCSSHSLVNNCINISTAHTNFILYRNMWTTSLASVTFTLLHSLAPSVIQGDSRFFLEEKVTVSKLYYVVTILFPLSFLQVYLFI